MTKKNEVKAKTDIKLNIPVKFKLIESKSEDDKGLIEAYVSIFDNIDLCQDVIVKGAFAESLAKKLPKGVWSHDWDKPIAKTLTASEDDKGLLIKGQFNLDTQRGKEAYSDIKFGLIDEFSIGFRVLDDEWREDGIRVIKKARLYEWSPVLVGANPDTELVDIKGKKKKTDKENIKKVDFVKVDEKTGKVELFYREGKEKKSEVLQMSDKFKKYQKEQKALKKKVAVNDGGSKATPNILRIKQVAKQNIKSNQYLLRITKFNK